MLALSSLVCSNLKYFMNSISCSFDKITPCSEFFIFDPIFPLEQRKYGIDIPAFALVGGLINTGESPAQAARRELLEETGLEVSDDKQDMVSLGKYRVQVWWPVL